MMLKVNARQFQVNPEIPEAEKASLPFAIEIFQEMMEDPENMCCPISSTLFVEPVVDGSGDTFDKTPLLRHFSDLKEKGVPLFSPMSRATLEDDRVILNKSKKSEVEEYKMQRANRCFELAQQCVKQSCGETALLLIDRVKQLNPQKEGLKEIEEVAKETFISMERKRVAYTNRAVWLQQAGKCSDALALLKPFAKEPQYSFQLGENFFYSGFLSPDLRYAATCVAEYGHNDRSGRYIGRLRGHVVEIETQRIMYCNDVDKELSQYNTLGWFRNRELLWQRSTYPYTWNFEIVDIETKTIKHSLSLSCGCTEMSNPSCNIYEITDECLKIELNHGYYNSSNTCRSLAWIRRNGTSELVAKQIKSYDNNGAARLKEGETKIELLKYNIPPPVLWNGRWPKDFAQSVMRVNQAYCNRIKSSQEQKPCFQKIIPKYSVSSDTNEIDFYRTLFKLAVICSDLSTYLNASEHLMGYYHEKKNWKELESFALSASDGSEKMSVLLEQEIDKTEKNDTFLISRLYLSLGLLKRSWVVKKEVYKKAKQPLGDHFEAVSSALEYVKACKQSFLLGSVPEPGKEQRKIEELSAQITRQQAQIQKLETLVHQLLEKSPSEKVSK